MNWIDPAQLPRLEMNRELHLLALDVDGTLYFSKNFLADAYQDGVREWIAKTGVAVAVPDEQALFDSIGWPVHKIYQTFFPDVNDDHRHDLSMHILASLTRKIRERRGSVFPGAVETLKRVSAMGIRIAVVTNARRPYMEAVLETHFHEIPFIEAICHGDYPDWTKGGLLREVIRRADVEQPERVLMVGDRGTDLHAAIEAGTRFLSFISSPQSEEELAGRPAIRHWDEFEKTAITIESPRHKDTKMQRL